jgi:hypothetical protein
MEISTRKEEKMKKCERRNKEVTRRKKSVQKRKTREINEQRKIRGK